MSQHLDRIRRSAGIAAVATSSSGTVAVRPATVATILESATPTRTDLTSLRMPAGASALAAAIAAALHRFALEKLAEGGGRAHTLQRIAMRILSFGGTNVWAPWVGGVALLLLAVVAVRTHGFEVGTLPDTVAGVAGIAAGAVAALPAAIALAYGLVVLAVAIVIAVMLLIAIVMMIGAMLSEL